MSGNATPQDQAGRAARRLVLSVISAFLFPLIIWLVWYRVAGYRPATVMAAQTALLVLAVGLVLATRLGFRETGLSIAKLPQALAAGAIAYAAVMGLAFVLQLVGLAELQILRTQYRLDAFVSSWALTAFGEELLFAGVIFTLCRRLFESLPGGRRNRWIALVTVAVLFALWHLPGYIVVGHTGGALYGRLGLNLASWLIFGLIYLFSANLWLVVIAHASTDYGLTPLITNEPLLGLLFMGTLVLAAWYLGRRRSHSLVLETQKSSGSGSGGHSS